MDEIEKVSTDVIRSLLNVLGSGVLVLPGSNQKIDFCNTMIFMTSNVGEKERNTFRKDTGRYWKKWLKSDKKSEADIVQDAIKSRFDLEFLNRLDRILYFCPLGSEHINQIIDIELTKLNQRLIRKEISLSLDISAKNKLHGYCDQEYGARDVARQFGVVIEPLLAKAFIENDEIDEFIVQYKNDKFMTIHSLS